MIDDYIAVIDIGTTKIVSMVGRKNPKGEIQILGFAEEASEGVNRGLVLNIKEASEVIEKVVEETVAQSGIKFNEVYVGIAGQHIKSRQLSHSTINDIDDIIEQELVDKLLKEVYNVTVGSGEKILHVFPQEYEVNGTKVKNPIGIMSKQLNGTFHISIVKDTSLNILKRSIENVNLTIKNVILEPVASAIAVLSPEEKEAGVALLDIGGGTTDLIIYKNNIIRHTAVIPFGGNSITKDIQEGCNIVFSKAEEIKKDYGSTIPDLVSEKENVNIPGIQGRESKNIPFKTISAIIQARIIEIIDTAYEEIKKSQYLNKLSAGLTITGGGSLLKDLKQLTEFRTGLETRVAYPTGFVYSDAEKISNPKYSTAVGLLKKAFEYQEKQEAKNIKKTKNQKTKNELNNNTEEQENEQSKKKPNIFKKTINKLKNILIEDDEIIDDDNNENIDDKK